MRIIQSRGRGSSDISRKGIEGEMSLSREEGMEATEEPALDRNKEFIWRRVECLRRSKSCENSFTKMKNKWIKEK